MEDSWDSRRRGPEAYPYLFGSALERLGIQTSQHQAGIDAFPGAVGDVFDLAHVFMTQEEYSECEALLDQGSPQSLRKLKRRCIRKAFEAGVWQFKDDSEELILEASDNPHPEPTITATV